MRIFFLFARKYPFQTLLMLFSLLLAGLLEGIGLSMLLPLLSVAMPGKETMSSAGTLEGSSKLERMIGEFFALLNINPSILNILLIILAAAVLKGILIIICKRQTGYTVARVATDLRLELLRSIMNARWEYFVRERTGHHTNSMLLEAKQSSVVFNSCVLIMADFLEAAVFVVTAFLVSVKGAMVAVVCAVTISFLLRSFIRRVRKTGQRQTRLAKDLMASMTDFLLSLKPLKAMAREELADYMLEKKTIGLQKSQQKQVMTQGLMKALQEPVATVFLAVGIYVTLVYWRIPLSNLLILLFLIARVLKQFTKIQERYSEIAVLESGYWSLRDRINTLQQHREENPGSAVPTLNKSISFNGVDFSYGENRVFHNLDLFFPVGQITAIVGPSGSGKTTIIDLVAGLLKPQAGEIRIDQLPLQEIDLKQWRQMIGYVPQETILLHDSIFNNVTLGDRKLSEQDARAALKAAGAMEFIDALPKGVHHVVGERGGELSGGQRQRIAIARAIVHHPKLLIFDEATSALDPVSEAMICQTMRSLRGELTILAISHQTALLDCADRGYCIRSGTADQIRLEEGNHLISAPHNVTYVNT